MWDKNEREDAMTLLSSYLSESDSSSAEAHLLHAKWRNETSSYDSEAIQQLFKKVRNRLLLPNLVGEEGSQGLLILFSL